MFYIISPSMARLNGCQCDQMTRLGTCLIFHHFQRLKFAKYLMCTFKKAKVFNIMPKGRIFAKSDHTVGCSKAARDS